MSDFDSDLETARSLLDTENLDGFFVGVVHDDELDYATAHEFVDPETTGLRALSLLATHVEAFAEQANAEPEQVARDVVRMLESRE